MILVIGQRVCVVGLRGLFWLVRYFLFVSWFMLFCGFMCLVW